MENPLVTIIITVYNNAELAIEAIKSVMSQDYNNTQIVIIDDASTDNSVETICKWLQIAEPKRDELTFTNMKTFYGVAHSNVQNVFYKPLSTNRGRAGARNEGLKTFPQSDIYGFLDADDIYLPTKISKSVAKIVEDPDVVGIVYSDYISYNLKTGLGVPELRPPFDIVAMRQNCLINNDSLVNAKALAAVGLYDESMEVAEDYDLWLRITTRFVAIHIPELLVRVGVSETNASKTVPMPIWQKNWNTIRQRMQAGIY